VNTEDVSQMLVSSYRVMSFVQIVTEGGASGM